MFSAPYEITVQMKHQVSIIDIAMGSHHVLALTKFGEMYSWGRNDEGQCGQGYNSSSVDQPKVIENMLYERIKSVHASENFSACLSQFGFLYTCGSGEFGKLGNNSTVDQSDFDLVDTKQPINKVAMGVHHMAAIVAYDDSTSLKNGCTLVWGRNHKGQLGIGSTDQCTRPEEVTKLDSLGVTLIAVQ